MPARSRAARRSPPTRSARAGSTAFRHGLPESRLAAAAHRDGGGFVAGLTRFGDDLVPRRCRVGWVATLRQVFPRRISEQAASRDAEPPGAPLHLMEEIIRDRDGRFHGLSITSYTPRVKVATDERDERGLTRTCVCASLRITIAAEWCYEGANRCAPLQ